MVSFQLLAQRRYQWHLTHIAPITWAIAASMSLIAFSGWQEYSDRINLIMLGMLTFITCARNHRR